MNYLLISHRGNIDGKTEQENQPAYIKKAISQGYDVEIDIWHKNNRLYLGHDKPQYITTIKWICSIKDKLWIHCKNIEALCYFKDLNDNSINYFWHQEDDVTLTSKGFLWTYPGKELTKYSIAVLPEYKKFDNIEICHGICSDFIESYK